MWVRIKFKIYECCFLGVVWEKIFKNCFERLSNISENGNLILSVVDWKLIGVNWGLNFIEVLIFCFRKVFFIVYVLWVENKKNMYCWFYFIFLNFCLLKFMLKL